MPNYSTRIFHTEELLLITCPETSDWLVWHRPTRRWIARLQAIPDRMDVRLIKETSEIVMFGYVPSPASPNVLRSAGTKVLWRFDLKGLIPTVEPMTNEGPE